MNQQASSEGDPVGRDPGPCGPDTCFIIGSPRSGTTILCDVLGQHPQIERVSEPYFLWDWFHGGGDDDVRTAADATPEVRAFLQREFSLILAKSGKRVLVEKTPENCFRIPFMRAVFPNAQWIHIVRDGRDVVVSMRTEWQRREAMVRNRSLPALARTAGRMLYRQKYWRNRYQALRHELGQNMALAPGRYFNKAKWKGYAAWGPRFPDWEAALNGVDDVLAFNAMQWRECVNHAQSGLRDIEPDRLFDIRYEDLASEPAAMMARICRFLGVDEDPAVGRELSARSVGKWRSVLDDRERALVEAQIGDTLASLGYSTAS